MRQRRGEAKVVWIYVDPCDYGVMPFANLEGMPKAQDGSLVPLAGFSRNKRADHLASISKRIREIAEKIGGAEDRKFASRKYNGLSADTLNDKSIRESLEERIRDISAELNVSLALLRSVLANLVGTQVQ